MSAGKIATWPIRLNSIDYQILADPAKALNGKPGYTGRWTSQTTSTPLELSDVPLYLRNLGRGAGFMERRDEGDDGGYAWGEDVFTHLKNGVMLSGRRTLVGLAGLGVTGTAVVDSRRFNGHLWCLTTSGVLLRLPNADPTQTMVIDPALNAFLSPTASFRSGYVARAIEVFETYLDGAGAYLSALAGGTKHAALYVSTFNSGTGETRIYQYTAAFGWAEGLVLGYRADRMAACWWEGKDGIGAYRLHIQVDDNTIRHCIAGEAPLVGASDITPIPVGSAAHPITRLVAAPTHLWVRKTDGLWDVSEARAANVTPYQAETPDSASASATTVYDDGVYMARQFGVDRFDVRLGSMVQQRITGACGPGYGWQDGGPVQGQVTDFAQHDGWLLMSLYNAESKTSYLGRAAYVGREVTGTENPMVHHWAEQVINPTAGVGQQITHLAVVSPTVPAGTVLTARSTYVLMFTADDPFSAGANFNMYYAPLPNGSGPLSLQVSSGTFTFNTQGAIFYTAQNWKDRNAEKHVMRFDLDSQGLATTEQTPQASFPRVTLLSRPDGDPRTILTPATWKTEGITTKNSASITPATATTAHLLGFQAILNTVSPFTTSPVLREISPRARVARELIDSRTLYVLLARGVETDVWTEEVRDTEVRQAALEALQSVAPVPFEDECRRPYSVLVQQGIEYERVMLDEHEWQTVAAVTVRLVAAA